MPRANTCLHSCPALHCGVESLQVTATCDFSVMTDCDLDFEWTSVPSKLFLSQLWEGGPEHCHSQKTKPDCGRSARRCYHHQILLSGERPFCIPCVFGLCFFNSSTADQPYSALPLFCLSFSSPIRDLTHWCLKKAQEKKKWRDSAKVKSLYT